jgi:hypothetical protein
MIRDLQTEVRNVAGELRLYRSRATQAEQACADWKARFDKLLEFRQLLKSE